VGDFDGLTGLGLFYRDVRHLSGFRLRINGVRPAPLASWTRGSEAEFALSAGVGVGGMEEEILFSNEADVAVEVRAELECAADFRDVLMEEAARRALGWLLDHADRVDGYVAYATRSAAGLKNQGWKYSVTPCSSAAGLTPRSP
jgi:hypothetical protein